MVDCCLRHSITWLKEKKEKRDNTEINSSSYFYSLFLVSSFIEILEWCSPIMLGVGLSAAWAPVRAQRPPSLRNFVERDAATRDVHALCFSISELFFTKSANTWWASFVLGVNFWEQTALLHLIMSKCLKHNYPTFIGRISTGPASGDTNDRIQLFCA